MGDYDFHGPIIRGLLLRQPLIDFQTGHDAELEGRDDSYVLAYAAREGRLLVSHDRRTMPYHFAEFIQIQTSPGVFLLSQRFNFAKVVDDIVLIWAASEVEEWINNISKLPFTH